MNIIRIKTSALLLAVFAVFATAQAGTIHVAPGGTGAGTSWSDPLGDIQAAVDAAVPDDTILLAGGTYAVSSPVAIGKIVFIRGGYDPATGLPGATPTVVTRAGGATTRLVSVSGVSGGELRDVTLSGGVLYPVADHAYGAGIQISGSTGYALVNCTVSGNKALDAGDFDPTFQMISITDRAVTFYNRIVERAVKDHPDLLFSALAYVQYTRPPVRERPHKNLVIQFAPITYSRAHPMDMDAVPDNIALRDIVAGWGKASQAMSYYFYAYYLADPVSTAPFLRKWAVDIPYIYKNGSCRYWQPETMGNNEFFFMAQWMAQRMAWNPEQDPWALYREANDAMYGPAAETMWAFWNAVDKCWVETPEYSGAGWGHLNRFTPERVAEISALIARAAKEAGAGPARERVRLAETSWRLTSGFVQLRRDLAEGRWKDLDTRSQAWKKAVSQAAIASGDHRCYAWCWFGADKTFGGQYYDWFYSRTHASAQNIATNATLLVAKPVRDFRWKAAERGALDTEGFAKPGFDDAAWPTTDVTLQTWSSLGLHNHMGSMWYRTTIDVAKAPAGKKVWLWVGSTDGAVKAFVNGQAVQGGVEPRKNETFKLVDEPASYGAPLRFDVTSAIRPGANAIALFATRGAGPNEIGTGGLLSPVVVYAEK